MKLYPPNIGQSQTEQPNKATSTSNIRSTRSVQQQQLPALSNTWAKVESSNWLTAKESQQQWQSLANQLPKGITQEQASKQYALTQLRTQQGLMDILTTRVYPANSQVLISQDKQGNWQLQHPPTNVVASLAEAPKTQQILETLLQQSSIARVANRQPINLDTRQFGSLLETIKPLLEQGLTPQLNKQNLAITPELIKQAIQNNGQGLEQNLQQWSKSNQHVPLKTKIPTPNQPTTGSQAQTQNNEPNLQRAQQVTQANIQKWIAQAAQWLKQPAAPSKPESGQATSVSANTHSTVQVHSATNIDTKPISNPLNIPQLISSDIKAQLMVRQSGLMTALKQHISEGTLELGPKFIPNWSHSTSNQDGKLALDQWLTLLMAPKVKQGELPVWPNNLNVQAQIQHTVQNVLNHVPANSSDEAILKQLLNVSQSLLKIQHDQIHNRLSQVQVDLPQPQIHMSLPYVFQGHVNWCDLEFQAQPESQEDEQKTEQKWRLVLRFAQDTEQHFAIESHMIMHQLNITLWAEHKYALKHLQENIPVLREKLQQAGFVIEHIKTQHGTPNRAEHNIAQSLVDIRT